MLRRAAFALLWLLAAAAVPAAGQELRVSILTVGPGELPYERFGHNAILFELDDDPGSGVAFDWGRFDFDQPGFIRRFAAGDMLYSSGVSAADDLIHFYRDVQRRFVLVQELNLTPEQAQSLLAACQAGAQPENREYTYDYFLANCSTKLRDALDAAVGGQLKEQLAGVATGTTFRREAERHMAADWPLWFAFHAGFGPRADMAIDAWQRAFLPGELAKSLRTVTLADDDGSRRPLVGEERVVSVGRDALLPPAQPPSRWWQTGLIGLGVAGLIALPKAVGRPALARAAAALWFLLCGAAGFLGLFIWHFTSHWSGHANQSILLLSPLGVPLAVMTLANRWPRATAWTAAVHLGLCVLATVLHLIPGVGQENLGVVTLALPANLAAAWAAGVGRPVRPSGTADSPAIAPATA